MSEPPPISNKKPGFLKKFKSLFDILLCRGKTHSSTAPSSRSSSSVRRPVDSTRSAAGGPFTTPKDRLSVVLNVLSQVLNAATAATAVFPPAQAVVGGVASGVNMAKSMVQNQLDREAVKRNLKEAQRRIGKCAEMASVSEEMASLLLDLERNLKEDIGSIDDAMHESWWKKLAEGDAQEMIKHHGKLSSRLSLFNTQTVISTNAHVEALKKITSDLKSVTTQNSKAISEIQADVKFKALRRVTKAEYNTGPHDLRRSCTPETRQQILADLMTWATDDTNTNVYWLSGMAGTGKTTIAYSFCELLHEAGLLATSYFCSRAVADSTEPKDFLPTVSYHLASYSPSFSQALLDGLRDPDNVNIREKVLEEQFSALILDPSKASSENALPKRRVLVYDGADEANNMKEVAKLISLFLKNAADLPFKVFISSRRDEIIRSEFGNRSLAAHSTALILHDIEESLVNADIRLYILERLGRFHFIHEALDTLAERSGKLFVYASVLCSFLDHSSEAKVKDRLQAVLNEASAPTDGTPDRPYRHLDEIYCQILSAAAYNKDVWPVLLTILSTQVPLMAASIANVLGFQEYRVTGIVADLHAVLTSSDSKENPINIFHTSFRDFLYDKNRGGEFYHLISNNHELLLTRSLQIMKADHLANDIYKRSTRDTTWNSVKPDIKPDDLAYTCMSWVMHLLGLTGEQVAMHEKDVLNFFDKHILRWIECMSWHGHLQYAVSSLRKAELSHSLTSELHDALVDARRFILQSFPAIQESPLEVYHSALVWLPKTSRIRKQHQWPDWQVIHGLPAAWDACESVLTGHKGAVNSVATSQEGKWIVSGSDDETVQIWNIETGQKEQKLEGHSGNVQSVSFSPDGMRVVSGSDDETVRIWNIETGQEEQKLEGHSGNVQSVFFSPDGRRVVSGSSDTTVRIWNIETGQEEDSVLLPSGSPHGLHEITLMDGSLQSHSSQLWMPSEFHNYTCVATSPGAICLGYYSGQILIVHYIGM